MAASILVRVGRNAKGVARRTMSLIHVCGQFGSVDQLDGTKETMAYLEGSVSFPLWSSLHSGGWMVKKPRIGNEVAIMDSLA